MEWDEVNGVWKGNAAASAIKDLPDPLYIFGYGSLLWKPGDMMSKYQSFPCACKGFVRLFAQRSMDHRGTSDFPGFVATLARQDELLSHYHSHFLEVDENMFLPECIGNVYLVPQNDAKTLIEELDFREKGGYHRHLISIRLLQSTPFHNEQEWATALVYTGPIENPNFSIKSNSCVAGIVSSAIGPSGENAEYLLKLTDYIRSHGLCEQYLWNLEREMLLKMCAWRSRSYMLQLGLTASSWDSVTGRNHGKRLGVVGWGSNEYFQLDPSKYSASPTGINHKSDENLIPIAEKMDIWLPQGQESIEMFPDRAIAGGSLSGVLVDDGLILWGGMEHIRDILDKVAFCFDDRFSSCTKKNERYLIGVDNVAIGHDHMLLLLKDGRFIAIGNNKDDVCSNKSGIEGFDVSCLQFSPDKGVLSSSIENMKHNHNEERPIYFDTSVRHSVAVTQTGAVYAWGDKRFVPPDMHKWRPRPPGKSIDGDEHDISSVANTFYHLNVPIRILNATCGAKHTILVDSIGRMWSFGDNTYGQLGRDTEGEDCNTQTPKKKRHAPIDLNPECVASKSSLSTSHHVRWIKASCGWSHNIAKGITPEGMLVFAGWGRCDMGQLPQERSAGDSAAQLGRIPYPIKLPSPGSPEKDVGEAWCGSEFSIASDIDGFLWGCGWSEHGNLAQDPKSADSTIVGPNEMHWTAVLGKRASGECEQLRLEEVWEGAVSCGGAHCISIGCKLTLDS